MIPIIITTTTAIEHPIIIPAYSLYVDESESLLSS